MVLLLSLNDCGFDTSNLGKCKFEASLTAVAPELV